MEIALIPGHTSAAVMASRDSRLYVRGSSYLQAIDLDNHRPLWLVELAGDHPFGYKPLRLFGHLLLTAVHRDDRPDPMWVAAHDLQDGGRLWDRQLNWQINRTWGGLVSGDDSLAYLEPVQDEIRAIRLDPESGQITARWSGPLEADGSPRRAVSLADGWLYFIDRLGRLGRLNTAGTDNRPEQVIVDGDVVTFSSRPEAIYCLVQAETYHLVAVDPRSGRSEQRHQLGHLPAVLGLESVSAGGRQIIMLRFTAGQGLAAVEPASGELLWHIGAEERWSVGQVVATPYGLVFFAAPGDQDGLLLQADPITGETSLIADDRDEIWFGHLHWTGKELAADGIGGLHFFGRQTGDSQPYQPAVTTIKPGDLGAKYVADENGGEFTPSDQAFSAVVDKFIRAMAAGRDSREHRLLAGEFNRMLNAFLDDHPEAELASFAQGLAQLGVPYEQALADLVYMRSLEDI